MFPDRSFHTKILLFFFAVILSVFFIFRPLNSSWFRIITADGLGYYSYLPAKFIYHDDQLNFKWFNEIYPKYYSYNSFSVPTENFMTPFKEKQINKYFPGLSFLWLPFFLIAHFISKFFGFPADGFSLVYQVSIGLAGIFYSCLGLWYLRKLILKLFKDELIALIVPLSVFFGTNLFYYTIYVGSFTHVYSFTFISLGLYYAYNYFNEPGKDLKNILLFLLCFLVVIFIRPFNVLFLIGLPAFYKRKELYAFISGLNISNIFILTISMLLIVYQFTLLYKQTHSFFPYTYTNERFYFNRKPHVFEILFSYQCGWFLYVPLAFISFAGLFFIKNKRPFLVLFFLILLIIYLYASWWSWAIFTRTIVDFTAVIGILLAFFLYQIRQKKIFKPALVIVLICVSYFQLKSYQFRNGILNYNYTYGEYYWKYFFTTRSIDIFPVNPATVINEEDYFNDFEESPECTDQTAYEGKRSMLVDSINPFSKPFNYGVPSFFEKKGFCKIKTSFWVYFTKDIPELQLVFQFLKNDGAETAYIPFYIQKNRIRYNEWEFKEFGCDLPDGVKKGDSLKVFFWDPSAKGKAYIDNLKTQFFLTDSSMEMIP